MLMSHNLISMVIDAIFRDRKKDQIRGGTDTEQFLLFSKMLDKFLENY